MSGGPFAHMTPEQRRAFNAAQIVIVQTWWYGRPLVDADLELVRAADAARRSTQGLFRTHARGWDWR